MFNTNNILNYTGLWLNFEFSLAFDMYDTSLTTTVDTVILSFEHTIAVA